MGEREFLGDVFGYLTRWKANIVIQLSMMNHWMQYVSIVNEFPSLSCPSERITSLSIVCIAEQSSWKWIYFSEKECPRARVTLTMNSTLHVHQLARTLYFHDPIARIYRLIKQQWTWWNVRSSCLHSRSVCPDAKRIRCFRMVYQSAYKSCTYHADSSRMFDSQGDHCFQVCESWLASIENVVFFSSKRGRRWCIAQISCTYRIYYSSRLYCFDVYFDHSHLWTDYLFRLNVNHVPSLSRQSPIVCCRSD